MLCFPNAKINIGLNIIEKRKDGFHNIETIFYPIGLCDILEFIHTPEVKKGEFEFIHSGLNIGTDLETNLVYRAYKILSEKYNLPTIKVALHKIIPIGAGLGGGSSNASYMLKALNTTFKLEISENELTEISSLLGSDCPFFIQNKTVFAYNKGDIFADLNISLCGNYLVLIYPNIHINTQEAYSKVLPTAPQISLLELTKLPIEEWKDTVVNDFEYGIFKHYPLLEEIKLSLYKAGAIYASMSGSGSSLYGIFAYEPVLPRELEKYFIWKEKLN